VRRPRSIRAVFALPLLIAVLSALGLLSALTGDGWRDMMSWLGLAAPVLAVMWAMRVRRT
jgi:hypothetical protein